MQEVNALSNSNTKEKEYKKFINFGKIYLAQPSITTNETNFIDCIKQDMQSKFCNDSKYIIDKTFDNKQERLVDKAEKLVFTKLTSSNSHFFGTFSKVSNTKDVLTDIVDNVSNEKIDPDTIYFEHNTLFYIDFEKSAISFIKTNRIKNVYPFLESFLNSNNFINLKIAPFIKTEDEIVNSIITHLDVAISNPINTQTEFVELKNLEKMGCSIRDYKIDLSIQKTTDTFPKRLLSFCSKNKQNIKKISISTLDEDIDLITNTFTKSVPIKLNNNYENDYNVIEQTLKAELFKAIQ